MKLLNSFVSPFAARVRLAIYAYDLPVEIAPSGQWTRNWEKSPEYLAINPIGRVPTLVLDEGTALPESGVIVEYLADAFPGRGLRPENAEAAARVRLLAHIAEIYVQIPAGPLFMQLFATDRDQARVEAGISAIDEGLSHLDHFLDARQPAVTDAVTIADCALIPFLYFFAEQMVETLGRRTILDRHPNLRAYWEHARALPSAQKVLAEMHEAIAGSRLSMLVAIER